jgi:undecaprenyl-diphosphatase
MGIFNVLAGMARAGRLCCAADGFTYSGLVDVDIRQHLPALTRQRMVYAGLSALVAACVTLFIKIADEVMEGETRAFDEAILLSLRSGDNHQNPIGPWWLEVLFSDFTSLGSAAVLVFMALVVCGYFVLIRRYFRAVLVIGSFIGAQILNSVLKFGFARPRPSIVAPLGEVHTLSFPSGHAMLSAVIYLTLGILLASTQKQRGIRWYIMGVAVVIALLVGGSRVYLGVHYPTDVIAGWAAGLAWACLCWLCVSIFDSRRGAAGVS